MTELLAHDTLLYREAAEAPARVGAMLANNRALCGELGERLRQHPPRFVVTGARGSSDSAAAFVKHLCEVYAGRITASVGPSISSVYGATPSFADSVFVAISQSGRSPDLASLAQAAVKGGAITIAIVNDTDSPLAGICEYILPLDVGPERSVAATKSYIASLAAGLQLAAHWSRHPDLLAAVETLPSALQHASTQDWSAAAPRIAAANNLYVVGRGPGFAVAQEMALKLKETALIHAEAFSTAEVMHGPVAIVDSGFPVIVLGQEDQTLGGLQELIAWLDARQVPTIAIGPAALRGTLSLSTQAGLPSIVAPIAALQSFYRLAADVAVRRGHDPDKPRFLHKVTATI